MWNLPATPDLKCELSSQPSSTAACASGCDVVNHPIHYTTGKIEVLDFIEDQKLPYHLGNVVKYICRAPHKGTEMQDLRKAQWYLNRYIALLEK